MRSGIGGVGDHRRHLGELPALAYLGLFAKAPNSAKYMMFQARDVLLGSPKTRKHICFFRESVTI